VVNYEGVWILKFPMKGEECPQGVIFIGRTELLDSRPQQKISPEEIFAAEQIGIIIDIIVIIREFDHGVGIRFADRFADIK